MNKQSEKVRLNFLQCKVHEEDSVIVNGEKAEGKTG
jgi:hypothetical protein